jgi:tetratricopeptide (TPR) repeat protein
VRWLRYAPAYQKWAASGLVVLLLATAGYVFRQKLPFQFSLQPGAAAQPVSLAILPFRNASGDAAMDWLGPSLAEMLRTDVGQSASLRTVSADRIHQIIRDLRLPANSEFDPGTLKRLAEFSSAETLVWGQFAKVGDQIRIDATLEDIKRQRTMPLKVTAATEKELLQAVQQLAQSIQQNLALPSDVLKELRAKAFRPSSNSVQALRAYNEGLELVRSGNNLEAAKRFEVATQQDQEFALAYSKLGQTYSNLGYDDKAEQASRKAVVLSEKLSPQERYRILAIHAQLLRDNQKAVESYENLAKVSPDDRDVQFTLAGLYENTGSFDLARQHFAKVLERDPKSVDALLAIGRVEIRSGKPQSGLEYLNQGLSLAIQLENQEERAMILQAIGIAYGRLNKPDEALRNFQESLEIKRRLGQKRGIADSLNEMAKIQASLGKPELALKGFDEALKLRREIGDKSGIGSVLVSLGNFQNDRGQYDQALTLFKESLQIQRDLGNENYQALCLNNIGNAYLFKGDYDNARTYFEQALQLRDKLKVPGAIADTLHNLAETSTKMGQYDQALSQYLRALDLRRGAGDKRGAAIESYGMGTLFGYQGRYGAALTSKEEALKTFRELQDRSFWLAEILSGYGSSLSEIGRFEEAQKNLDEALSLARELRNQALTAQILSFQGDVFFYRGELKPAGALYEQALQTASRTSDRHLVLVSKVNLARLAIPEGHPQAAASTLQGLAREADTLGLKYLSTECTIDAAEAQIKLKDYARARQQLESVLGRAERLGLRAQLARAHYLLASALRLSGKAAEASGHSRQARQILEDIHKEAQRDDVLKRADLSLIYAETPR